MLLTLQSFAAYDLPAETFLLLMVEPALSGPTHTVRDERLLTTATVRAELQNDLYNNPQRRLLAPAGYFSFDFIATVESQPNMPVPDDAVEHRPQDIPPPVLAYTLPSRYCQSDLLARLALDEFGGMMPGGARVNAILAWVRRHVLFLYGTTDSLTSAYDTITQRVGVCRDFAHLTIALCRALGIPARYVSGYALDLDPPDFHGYAQVYLSDGWHNVDATFEGVRPALVPIAVGRDAADVAMATLFGAATLREQSVTVTSS